MNALPRRKKLSTRRKAKKKSPTLPQEAAPGDANNVAAVGSQSFPVVGIGASAGGLAAVTELLKHLPRDVRVGVVVIQHLDPQHGSLTSDILSRVSAMPVTEVTDGMRVQ